ncbi:MAG: YdcF family protein [Deltaproteobacteria bacterium]|nr:MAG: YdcF family protein [Deltaproteobacteria bacterium]
MQMANPPLEALIVLGGRVGADGYPGRPTRLRLLHALELWREHCPEARFLLSGGQNRGAPVSEARAMAAWSLKWVEENWGAEAKERLAALIVLEETSKNTAASAHNVLALAQSLGLKRLGLVTDHLHMRRAHYLFRRQAQARVHSLHPLPFRGLLRDYWQRRRFYRLAKMLLREGGAWVKVLGKRLTGG